MKKRIIVSIVLLLAFFMSCKVASSQRLQQVSSQKLDFSLKDIKGNTVSLSDFEGQGVILFFWTTWCPHCRNQLIEFNKKYKDIVASGIQLVSIDVGESEGVVRRFVQKNSLAYPVLLDYNNEVSEQYDVSGVPTIVLISKERTILDFSYRLPSNYRDYFSKNGS